MTVLLTANGKKIDITPFVQTVSWSGDTHQCARCLELEYLSPAYGGLAGLPAEGDIAVGANIGLYEATRCLCDAFIVSLDKSTQCNTISLTCFDRGFYLKKNKATYGFRGLTPQAITRRVCKDFGISCADIVASNTPVTRDFFAASLYDIIMTAYTKAHEADGKAYYCIFRGADLCVLQKQITAETLVIASGSNLMNAARSESIENMVNSVLIYDKDEKHIGTEQDAAAKKLYGVMQECLRDNDGDGVRAAKRLIARNGLQRKITVENLGNIANITGGTVVVQEPFTRLYGLFWIDSDIHTFKNGLYFNKLTLNFKAIMDEKEVGALPNKDGDKTSGGTAEYVNPPGWNAGGGSRYEVQDDR